MAVVVITITDGEDGITNFRIVSDPPIETSDMDSATDAQILGLGFLAECVQSAASITEFSANDEEVNLS
jgi:hypothetical protein